VRYRVAFALYERKDYAACSKEVASLLQSKLAQDVAESVRELSVFAAKDAGDASAAKDAMLAYGQTTSDAKRALAAARAVGKILVDAKRTDDAAALWQGLAQSKAMAAVLPDIQAESAYALLDQGKPDEARAVLARALERGASPALAECAFFVGEALFAKDDAKGATPLYDVAASTKDSPVKDRALYKLGFACLKSDDFKNAGKAFALVTKDCKDSPLFGESLFLAGEMLYRQDKLEEAVAMLARVKKEAPKHEVLPKALFRLGCALTKLDRHAEAEPVLAELAKSFPDFPQKLEAELCRGQSLLALGNARGAEQAFQRVATEDRGVLSARARIGLGKLRMNAGQHESALSDFLKVSVLYAHEEEVGESLLLAGQCLEKLGDRDRATEQYREVLKRCPASTSADAARAKLSQISGV
jgi:TolA-binding protein